MFQVNPARQRIHMKNQALFSLKDRSKKLKCHLLQFLFGALRLKFLAPKNKKEKIILLYLQCSMYKQGIYREMWET